MRVGLMKELHQKSNFAKPVRRMNVITETFPNLNNLNYWYYYIKKKIICIVLIKFGLLRKLDITIFEKF